MDKKDSITTYKRFSNYDKIYHLPDSEILIPPFIYNKITKTIKGNVLDIGCADGYKLKKLLDGSNKDEISSVDAIEPSPLYKKAIQLFKDNKKVKIFNKELKDIINTTKKYDTIMLFEVIEHVPSPEEMLQQIKKILKPDGILILSTPNRPMYHLLCHLKGEQIDPTHISELSYIELKKLLNKNFKKNEIIGFFPFMFIIRKFPFLDKINIVFRHCKFLSRTIYSFSSD